MTTFSMFVYAVCQFYIKRKSINQSIKLLVTVGDLVYPVAAAKLWNKLPSDIAAS